MEKMQDKKDDDVVSSESEEIIESLTSFEKFIHHF